MRLTYLEIENFRQFFGKTARLRFHPAGNDKNVVVIHGANGSGKTALLNAFTWALYGTFTRGFQYHDQLINKRALRSADPDDSVHAWVEVGFEHDQRTYSLRRTVSAQRVGGADDWQLAGDPQATLCWCDQDGKWHRRDDVDDAVGRILPVDLHHYFFFDGERIERLVVAEKEEQRLLGKATRKLLGIEVLERGANHLNEARKTLEKELQSIGDPETQQLLAEKEGTEQDLEEIRAKISEFERNIEESEKQQQEIDDRLRKLGEVRVIQERRDQLQNDKRSRSAQFAEDSKALANLVSSKGFSVFLPSAITEFRARIGSLTEKGELPAGIKRQFVDDLLETCTCICRRDLAPGGEAREAVEEWKAKAGLGDVEAKAFRMMGEVSTIEEQLSDVVSGVELLQSKRAQRRAEVSRIEGELEEIKTELENSPREEVSKLEIRRNEIQGQISRWNRDVGDARGRVDDLEAQMKDIDKRLLEHRIRERKQQVAASRVRAATDARERILRVRKLCEDDLRHELERLVGGTFSRISITPYVPEITERWALRLLESSGGQPLPVAASQGESQILSLAFISGIIELAKKKFGARTFLRVLRARFIQWSWILPSVAWTPFIGTMSPNMCRALRIK